MRRIRSGSLLAIKIESRLGTRTVEQPHERGSKIALRHGKSIRWSLLGRTRILLVPGSNPDGAMSFQENASAADCLGRVAKISLADLDVVSVDPTLFSIRGLDVIIAIDCGGIEQGH
jgi:hypothetical protein